MSTTNMTKLEAVNRILRASREHPVTSLGGGETDSLMAEQILDEIVRREQMTGLHLNTTEASFTPDATTSYVILPSDVTQVCGWNQHAHRNFFHREVSGTTYLYDADEMPATRVFDDDDTVYVRATHAIDFADLPLPHQFSCTDQAAQEYQMFVMGSASLNQHLQQVAGRSRAIARAYDMRSRPHNQFDDGLSQGPRFAGRYTPRSWPWNDLRRQ